MKLPSKTEFELLAILANNEEPSGRDLAKLLKAETGRSIAYGTLYVTLSRMIEAEWVRQREDQDEDGRLVFYSISHLGKRALNAKREEFRALSLFGFGGAHAH